MHFTGREKWNKQRRACLKIAGNGTGNRKGPWMREAASQQPKDVHADITNHIIIFCLVMSLLLSIIFLHYQNLPIFHTSILCVKNYLRSQVVFYCFRNSFSIFRYCVQFTFCAVDQPCLPLTDFTTLLFFSNVVDKHLPPIVYFVKSD